MSGGGSGGPVAPLLAMVDEWRKQNKEYLYVWVGTNHGPEKAMALEYGISFEFLPTAKLRRYLSFKNIFDIFKLFFAFLKGIVIVIKHKPKLICSAGGFVSVPLVWAGWLLRVPIHIHQQDSRPGLANKIMAPFVDLVTVTFEKSLKDYKESVWTGNPVRSSFKEVIKTNKTDLLKKNNLQNDKLIIFIIGGGTGSEFINDLILDNIKKLTNKYQIIHIIGSEGRIRKNSNIKDYHSFNFLDSEKMAEFLFLSDLIISRAGLGLITELSFLKKKSIIIPISNSHQEDNADILKNNEAALVLGQKELNGDNLINKIEMALGNEKYSQNIDDIIPKEAAGRICGEIERII